MKRTIFGLILLLFGCLCTADHNEVQDTIDFLQNGEQHFEVDPKYRDLTLLIGVTGTGKSTLTRFVAGNLTDLKSVKKGRSVFLIEYTKEDGIIGNSTTVSQTIYPDLVIDESFNAFYDCPGFDDSRNTSVQIAATYFIKKVVDFAHTIKFVLVANYNGLTIGESRDDFPRLVKHLSSFIKNITNYRDSISLVGTKAPAEPDENLIGNIADFLDEYRKEQMKHNATDKMAQYAVELVNILLTSKDNGTTLDRISVFKKPTKEGPLNEIKEMVEGRENIRKLILNRTTYSKKIEEDFGYSISDSSILNLEGIVTEINKGVKVIVKNIGDEIQKQFESESGNLGNLIALTNRFQTAHSKISAIGDGGDNLTSELIIDRVKIATKDLNISISNEHLNDISTRTTYIRFLQNFTTKPLLTKPHEWVGGLDESIKYLESSKNWYKFLSDIHTAYSQYDFRGNLSKYNVSNVDDWGKGGAQGIFIRNDTFQKFVKSQAIASLVLNMVPTQPQLNTLNSLLNLTIIQHPTVTCDKESATMIVKGEYVRLSDIKLNDCGDQTNHLHIFALHTVYVDSNLKTLGAPMNISILATRWYIWGDHEITVGGAEGGIAAKDAAAASTKSNEAGAAGIPGLPGGPSGHFVGLGLNFENDDKLTIHVVGGKGGPGQVGGAGFVAKEADVSGIPVDDNYGEQGLATKSYRKFEQITKPDCHTRADTHSSSTSCHTPYYVYGDCSFTSGDGGSGGLGGLPGTAKIVASNGKSSLILKIENGPTGDGGKPGIISDKMPKKIKMEYSTYSNSFSPTDKSWKNIGDDKDDSCPTADLGAVGKNSADIKKPEGPYSIDSITPISKFDAFVRANLEHPFTKDDLVAVLDLVSKNAKTN